jgi:8-oxo-dGTP pyrophosphatase MutT (NUDIX family)
MGRKTRDRIQFAALPYRVGPNGQAQILLLTSRETKRWVIPKGWPIRGLKPRHVAAREAYEEAGVRGPINGKRPIGIYHYEKRLPGEQLLCEVHVFLLRVSQQLEDWPEKGQRESRWVDVVEAAALVDEGGLAELIRSIFTAGRPQSLPRYARARIAKLLFPARLR